MKPGTPKEAYSALLSDIFNTDNAVTDVEVRNKSQIIFTSNPTLMAETVCELFVVAAQTAAKRTNSITEDFLKELFAGLAHAQLTQPLPQGLTSQAVTSFHDQLDTARAAVTVVFTHDPYAKIILEELRFEGVWYLLGLMIYLLRGFAELSGDEALIICERRLDEIRA